MLFKTGKIYKITDSYFVIWKTNCVETIRETLKKDSSFLILETNIKAGFTDENLVFVKILILKSGLTACMLTNNSRLPAYICEAPCIFKGENNV